MKTINSENITQNIQEDDLIRIIMQVSLAMIILALIFVAVMYLHNKRANQKTSNKERLSNVLVYYIFKFINTDAYYNTELICIIHSIKLLIKGNDAKSLFKQNLLAMHKLFEGEIKEKLEELYTRIGLLEETTTKLKKKNWIDKVQALTELKDLRLLKSREKINHLISDPNPRVSIMAMQSIMEIDQHPFKFLMDFNKPITRAQSIFISKKATLMKENQYEDVLMLLNHNEDSVIKLGIQMLHVLKLKESSYKLVSLLHHTNEEIKVQAFVVLASLDPECSFKVLQNFCESTDQKMLKQIILTSNVQGIMMPNEMQEIIYNRIAHKNVNQAQDIYMEQDVLYSFA
jgi:hypothetical protein